MNTLVVKVTCYRRWWQFWKPRKWHERRAVGGVEKKKAPVARITGHAMRFRALAVALLDRPARHTIFAALASHKLIPAAECPCCDYEGRFAAGGTIARLGTICPRCSSFERHRLFALAVKRRFLHFADRDVLHFAPTPPIERMINKAGPRTHRTADLQSGRAQMQLDIEAIDLPPASVDVVVASHVLEHVNDRRALSEIFRILRPNGQLIAMVPIIEGWAQTYEDPSIVAPEDRLRYFGRHDHVRWYGADFRDRLRSAGFDLDEYTAGPVDAARYRLERGHKVFVASRPS